MGAFSLFHRPSFHQKLASISSLLHIQALLASMFALSAHFQKISHISLPSSVNIAPKLNFYQLADDLVDQSLRECSDETPPLCLLQALILVTFQQLTNGVRGRGWRSVGTCVRIAYELQLHLIDKNPSTTTSRSTVSKCSDEEKRRAWWTIWEFDVFASAIRHLPTAIDWKYNETWLPIDDKFWYADVVAPSCKLDPDSDIAWKTLQRSGNKCPKAWFIVLNALMRCAQLWSYPHAFSVLPVGISGDAARSTEQLDIIANSLYCLCDALPPACRYQGELLAFNTKAQESFHLDGGKYSIHIMTQLARFMINHSQVFESTSRAIRSIGESSAPMTIAPLPQAERAAWNHYMSAASEIVSLIRNSSPKHVRYVNPFLANTVWLAAGAHVTSRIFGPILVDQRSLESSLDVLLANLNAFVSTWGVSTALQQKLSKLMTRPSYSRDRAVNTERLSTSASLNHQTSSGDEVVRSVHISTSNQFSEINHPSVGAWIAGNQGLSQINWSEQLDPSLLDFAIGPDLSSDPSGWGLDDILIYGGTT